jgi:hypothetical protein
MTVAGIRHKLDYQVSERSALRAIRRWYDVAMPRLGNCYTELHSYSGNTLLVGNELCSRLSHQRLRRLGGCKSTCHGNVEAS